MIGQTKSKFLTVFIIIILAAGVVLSVYQGIAPLFAKLNPRPLPELLQSEKGTYIEGEVYYSTDEYYEITHLIGGIIPMGYEHYYIIFNEDFTEGVLLRAESDWADNFDEDNYNEDGVKVGGVLKEMDHEMKNEVYNDFVASGTDIEISAYYLDGLSDKYGICTIIYLLLFAAVCVPFIHFIKYRSHKNKYLGALWTVAVIIDCILMVHTISML